MEFAIDDIWLPHEIHPETPKEGRPMTDLFPRFDIDQVTMTCRQRGEPYGLEFADMHTLSNTHLALEAAEFARDEGRYHDFHRAVFRAYFTEGRNIGDMTVLLDVARQCSLDADRLHRALAEARFAKRVTEGSEEAKARGVTAIPAFFFEGGPTITGAVSEDRFREVLRSLSDL
ncbi:hypothetical protein GM415_05910 [Pseudodesulfovibrio cashew]|uniref:DSBA-like thioredoxin domain-containing protein n=1 Tax=Pseudodesulfovibrio cashew TaxID=2678688 RepID=A0A6I6JF09_9BACT|nr:hypothetical protein GM415_05910 [Pseudodesulfovibrio cashew]